MITLFKILYELKPNLQFDELKYSTTISRFRKEKFQLIFVKE